MNIRLIVVVIMIFSPVWACSPPEEKPPPDKITVQLKWVHQAQFAGFYVAREQGYFSDENLDVTFIEGGAGIDLTNSVVSGKAQFGVIAPEDAIVKRFSGEALTAIAAIYRRSAVAFLSGKDSRIYRPQDFKGRTVAAAGASGGVRDFALQLNSLLKLYDLDASEINLVDYDPGYKGFINGTVDVTAAYLTGGVIKLRQQGRDFNIIWPGDFGVVAYSDVLVTRESLIKERPELVLRFLRAALRGWREAIGNPDMAVRDTLKLARIRDESLQKAMMEAQIPLIHTGENHIGWMNENVWWAMCDRLYDQKILDGPLDAQSVFNTSFLEQVYGVDGQ